MTTAKPTNYWEYIRIDDLLDLQGGLVRDESKLTNDEVLFITVHQVFELWFKLIVRELRAARNVFKADQVDEQVLSSVVRSVRRINVLLGRCADHFQVMETMSTRDYLGFRDKLMPASGFQSAQLREIEILIGLREEDRIPLGLEENYLDALRAHDGTESSAYRRVTAALADKPSFAEAFDTWLYRTPIDGAGPDDEHAEQRLGEFVQRYVEASWNEIDQTSALAMQRTRDQADRDRLVARYEEEKRSVAAFLDPTEEEGGARKKRIRAAMVFILTYRELPLLSWPREVLDGLIELEEAFVIFRQRHARMVERVIGRRTGTGGSAGVDYLDNTALAYRIFKDLWAVKALQIRKVAVPPLSNPEFYGFRNG